MIKVIIFDADGVIIPIKRRFSTTLAEEHGISLEKSLPFFNGPFQECLVGNADLKESISPYLIKWGWNKGVNVLLDYWFGLERDLDLELIEYIKELKKRGILCFVATNNEKYRFAYMLDKMNFNKIFDKNYCSALMKCKKPNQEFFMKIYKDLENIKKEEILFWDDKAENVEGAKDFGINAELYTSFEDFKEKMKQYMI